MADKSNQLQVSDRVQRVKDPGLQGMVKEIRTETTSKQDAKEKGLMVQVLWDNGTLSYFSPESLKKVS